MHKDTFSLPYSYILYINNTNHYPKGVTVIPYFRRSFSKKRGTGPGRSVNDNGRTAIRCMPFVSAFSILAILLSCYFPTPVLASTFDDAKNEMMSLTNIMTWLCAVAGVICIVIGIGEWILSIKEDNAPQATKAQMHMAFGIILLMADSIVQVFIPA